MTLPVLRPGQTHAAVPKLKRALVRELMQRDHAALAQPINVAVRTYGPRAVRGVKQFQRDEKLRPDGVVGEKTWRALGFDDKVVDERPPVLHGVPFEPGLMAVDGRWVDKPLAAAIVEQRHLGHWGGTVTSGYRPAWYQKRLWDAAVRKYGSEQAASKWVARPGTSHHGRKGGAGAVDVTLGEQLDRSSQGLFRPMSWEAWHVQLEGTRELPDEAAGDDDGGAVEVSAEELAEYGITMEDVDASVELLLERLDRANDQPDEEDEVVEETYDPEEALLQPGR